MKASICIFDNTLRYQDTNTVSELPDEVFLAAQRVAATTKSEVVHLNEGFYVLEHSPTGPFLDVAGDWLPVKIFRIEKCFVGGVRGEEMMRYIEKHPSPSSVQKEWEKGAKGADNQF